MTTNDKIAVIDKRATFINVVFFDPNLSIRRPMISPPNI